MQSTILTVDGVIITEGQSHYTLRFVEGDKEDKPVLYYDGKRVTRPWQVYLIYESTGDPHGGNANTA